MSMMTTEMLNEKVIELISSHIDMPVDEINLGSHFAADLSFDSLDIVEFVMLVEDEFGISVPDEESEKILTVKDAVEVIQKLIS